MPKEKQNEPQKTGVYEKTVQRITETLKPYLHKVTQKFVDKSIDKYAKDNPRYARMIEFEVRRRGDGAGLTQDVAEPIVWIGVKTAAALAIAAVSESIKNRTIKITGLASSLTIIANQMVEAFRLLPRYKAGLQGSLEMAKDRWHSIEETGVDPFNQQQSTREIHKKTDHNKENTDIPHATEEGIAKRFAGDKLKAATINPTDLLEQADRTASHER